ncbi:MAG: hypothetical protein MZW92_81985 [Comamonadaceae bacterium]|nr:hypothetical protein [Comamonadaceae bacterium]
MPVDRAVRAATRAQRGRRARSRNLTAAVPGGHDAGASLLGDPTQGARASLAEPECRRITARARPAPSDAACRSSGSRSRRARRSRWTSGTENMDWIARVAAPAHRVHAGRRRGQHRRDRHQRRRPALLERRGDDADAHPRHPGHDAGRRRWCSPASRRSTTPARSSAEDNFGIGGYERIMGPNGQAQYWARDLRRGVPAPAAPLRAHATSCPASASRAGAATADPVDARRPRLPARQRSPEPASRTVGDVFSDRAEPRAASSPSTSARVMRAGGRRRTTQPLERWADLARRARSPSSGTRTVGGMPGVPARHRVARPCRASASCRPTAREQWTLGHAVPACRRSKIARAPSTPPAATGRWWCWPTCRASTARPSRCAGGSWSTAPRSAAR